MTLVVLRVGCVLLLALGVAWEVEAQARPDGPDIYGAKNRFSVMAEYSNDSSHIMLGRADNIKLGSLGLQYQRRLIASRHLVLSYAAEFRPLVIQSNPVSTVTQVQTFPTYFVYKSAPELTIRCTPSAVPYGFRAGRPPVTFDGAIFTTCGRQSNFAQGFAPVGARVNLRPESRVQLTFSTFEGYLFSTKPLPLATAGSFNFAFELGAGVEYFLAPKRSVRLEYQVHHYSNDYTASANPGVDSGILKLTYSFGR